MPSNVLHDERKLDTQRRGIYLHQHYLTSGIQNLTISKQYIYEILQLPVQLINKINLFTCVQ